MCIICTGTIYKQNLELNVSNCPNLTSEKLQEVLIQCKNLIILDCSYCTSLTSLDLRSNINLNTLWCFNCTSLTSLDLRNNINLAALECYDCSSLTSLDLRSNINLNTLWCSKCTSLTSLDLQNNKYLTILGCNNCTSLTSMDLRNNIKLETLDCASCTSLTSLDLRNNIKLEVLDCYSCTSLTSLDLPKGYDYIDCSDCPWITQNKDFSNNLQRLIRIQRYYRKLVIIKYMKSQEFIEWVYSPTNIGGRLYKKWLLKNLK